METMREILSLQRGVCEEQRTLCLKTGNETMAAYYKCRIAELTETIKRIEGESDAKTDA